MSRIMLVIVIAAFGGVAAAQDEIKHREIRGPRSEPGERALYGHLGQVVFTKDGTKMATGTGGMIIVWNVADGKETVRMQLPDPKDQPRICFSDDGKTIVACGYQDPMMRVFDVVSGRQIREFEQPSGRRGKVFSSHFHTFSHDGKRAAFSGPGFFSGLDILDIATGKVTLSIKEQKDCRGCDFSPDGKRIACHASNGGINIWDAETGKLIREVHADDRFSGGAFKFIKYSADGKILASGGHNREALDIWNADTGKLVCTKPLKNSFIYSVAFAADNQSVLCVEAGSSYLYHLVAEKVVHNFNPPDRSASFATFTPDGKRAVLVGLSTEKQENTRQGAVYIYELPAKVLNPPAAQIDEATLETLWNDLNTDNDLRLQRIQQAFKAAPKPAVELFRKKIPPISKELAAKVEQWMVNLDDQVFTVRDQAMKDLKDVVHTFGPLIKTRQEKEPAGEIRNRLTFLLKQTAGEPLPASLVRELRALAILEQIATAEAVQLLTDLANGAPQARLTNEARDANERVGRGKSSNK
jgi:WD40 repeat protein